MQLVSKKVVLFSNGEEEPLVLWCYLILSMESTLLLFSNMMTKIAPQNGNPLDNRTWVPKLMFFFCQKDVINPTPSKLKHGNGKVLIATRKALSTIHHVHLQKGPSYFPNGSLIPATSPSERFFSPSISRWLAVRCWWKGVYICAMLGSTENTTWAPKM